MALHKNPSGHAWFDSEEELYRFLQTHYLPQNFGNDWASQIEFAPKCIIDYIAIDKKGQLVLIEVKNDFLKIKDMEQITRYHAHASAPEKFGTEGYRFQVICKGIDKHRKELLARLGWLGTEILQVHELVS